jgi:uncharacterized damage-inducible protein DinB
MSGSLLRDAVRMTILRDLRSLESEIRAYPDDESLWLAPQGISNSAGNLALHMCGNLRHFLGAALGGSGYARNRDAEFAARGMSRDDVCREVAAAISDVDSALGSLDESRLGETFPIPIAQPPKHVRTSDMLVHLAVHLTYHLGQVDYHRRLLTEGASAVGTLSLKDLPEARS